MKYTLILITCFLLVSVTQAQENPLLSLLSDSMRFHVQKSFVAATFKATRLVNIQTVEAPAKGALNFLIQHRFGQINSGSYNFFGLDNANLRLGFEFGITDRFTVGIGRSSYLKTFDGYLKYKLLRQTEDAGEMPVSVSLLSVASNYSQHIPKEVDSFLNIKYRTSFVTQLLIARKFSSRLSLQLVPTWLHFNLTPAAVDKNDLLALSMGARLKFTRRMALEAEYNYLPANQVVSVSIYNSWSIGWDIETGGHVFQLVFSNSQSMTESQFIAQNIPGVSASTGSWGRGDIYFGFNIFRIFTLKKQKQ